MAITSTEIQEQIKRTVLIPELPFAMTAVTASTIVDALSEILVEALTSPGLTPELCASKIHLELLRTIESRHFDFIEEELDEDGEIVEEGMDNLPADFNAAWAYIAYIRKVLTSVEKKLVTVLVDRCGDFDQALFPQVSAYCAEADIIAGVEPSRRFTPAPFVVADEHTPAEDEGEDNHEARNETGPQPVRASTSDLDSMSNEELIALIEGHPNGCVCPVCRFVRSRRDSFISGVMGPVSTAGQATQPTTEESAHPEGCVCRACRDERAAQGLR